MKRVRGSRWMCVASERGLLPKIGAVQLVFSKRSRDPWKNMLVVAINHLRVQPQQAITFYERRRVIEVMFKQLRSLGLGADQMLHRSEINRYWHLVCLAHLMMTHHDLVAFDATAGKPSQPTPCNTHSAVHYVPQLPIHPLKLSGDLFTPFRNRRKARWEATDRLLDSYVMRAIGNNSQHIVAFVAESAQTDLDVAVSS